VTRVDDLVQTLITGFLVSGLFIFIVWWFWRRYDQPSEAQLEREDALAKKKEEQAMWRAVEAQMAEEKAQMEEQAIYLRRKAEQTERAQPPAAGALTNAMNALDAHTPSTPPTPSNPSPSSDMTFEGNQAAPSEGIALSAEDFGAENDSDVLLAAAPVEVRQDQGVILNAPEVSEPDWALVEKLEQLASADAVEETPHPELPDAPDLEALVTSGPLKDTDSEEIVEWGTDSPEPHPGDWDVEWVTEPEEVE
jgi:hypothetical protein